MRARLPLALAAVALAALIGVAVTFAVVVATDDDDAETLVISPGLGMMGNSGFAGMMGMGIMGGGPGVPGGAEPVGSLQEAASRVDSWLAHAGFDRFRTAEVMAFSNGYYVAVNDGAGEGAFELLLDPASGWISQEPGPSMMWNTDYGMMGGRLGSSMMGGAFGGMMGGAGMMGGQQGSQLAEPLSAEQAQVLANRWLGQVLPGETAGEPLAFPGYYTLHTEQDGDVKGMLSVNAQTGAVWYHVWHGSFVDELEA